MLPRPDIDPWPSNLPQIYNVKYERTFNSYELKINRILFLMPLTRTKVWEFYASRKFDLFDHNDLLCCPEKIIFLLIPIHTDQQNIQDMNISTLLSQLTSTQDEQNAYD